MSRKKPGLHRLSASIVRILHIRPDATASEIQDERRRRLFTLLFVTIVIPVVVSYAVSDFRGGNRLDGIVETLFAVSLCGLAVLVVRLERPLLVYYAVLIALMALLAYLAADPIEGPDRLMWFFLIIPVATYTVGRRPAAVFSVLTLAILLIFRSGFFPNSLVIPPSVFSRFLITYVVLTVMVFFSEYAREQIHLALVEEHELLRTANKEIRRLSITDALTETYNRQYLDDRLCSEIERAHRYGHTLSLLLCDIDHFKAVNDTWGHQAGDEVLRRTAHILQTGVRQAIDWVARYGGEEFLIVLPETDQSAAMLVAERLRAMIASLTVAYHGTTIRKTASFGVASLEGKEEQPERMISAADACLYRAKEAGRNAVFGPSGALSQGDLDRHEQDTARPEPM
jgi:diguanylate cyclase (GGDEF)-like protein